MSHSIFAADEPLHDEYVAVLLSKSDQILTVLEPATMTTGLSVRTGVIGNIFRKSLRLSGRARLEHSVGQITTMISTDATRLDLVSAFVHKCVSSLSSRPLPFGLFKRCKLLTSF